MAKFLSDEWASEATAACNASADVRAALKGVDLTMQQAAGETKYFMRFRDGEATIALGEAPDADIDIAMDYDTGAEMDRGETSAQAAYMEGRLKITGNMSKLLQNQDVINAVAPVLASLGTDY